LSTTQVILFTGSILFMAIGAMLLFPEFVAAHHGSGFYWDGWRNWDGSWCNGLFNSSHRLVYYYCR